MPTSMAWISAFFSRSAKRIGVYVRFQRGDFCDHAMAALREEQDRIEHEAGEALNWRPVGASVSRSYDDPADPRHREEQLEWFAEKLNVFVNVFRHRIGTLWEEFE